LAISVRSAFEYNFRSSGLRTVSVTLLQWRICHSINQFEKRTFSMAV